MAPESGKLTIMESAAAQRLPVATSEDISGENSTIEFYDRHAAEYFERTVSADLSVLYERFLQHISPGGAILDVGAGSGRDMKALRERGFQVLGIDGSEQLAARATAFSGANCLAVRFDQLKFTSRFDGVWACASLLHVPKQQLARILRRLYMSLKRDGVLFISVRRGAGESTADDGRFFAYYDTDEVRRLVSGAAFRINDLWTSADQLANRSSLEWINVIAQKCGSVRSRHAKRKSTELAPGATNSSMSFSR